MDGDMEVSVDKLPIKRLDAIDETGIERFSPEVGPDEKRLALIRRIDFTPLVEKDAKKAKKDSSVVAAAAPWPWQGLVENLQLAQQELSVIIDLINTVEANDAVTVAMMTRPKQLPNEVLSDLAVSAATKLQCFRNLGRYFNQSKKALENQVAREARFYSALIRLQQSWKIKRHRLPATPGSEGFTIDLLDNSISDPTMVLRPSIVSTVRVDHDSSGMLAIHLPQKSCRSIEFGFCGGVSSCKPKKFSKDTVLHSNSLREAKKEMISAEDVDLSVKETHSTLREIHQAIFDEQVFDLVNREAFYPSPGVNVTSIREDYLQLGIGQEASIFLSLVPYGQETELKNDKGFTQNGDNGMLTLDKYNGGAKDAEKQDKLSGYPDPVSCEIYLRQILHENVILRGKGRRLSSARSQQTHHSAGEGYSLLGHFCMTLAHRVFSRKVLIKLENLVSGIPYLHLLSHPTWHSRTSSWSLSMTVPQSTIHARHWTQTSDATPDKNIMVRSQFYTKVVVRDESINVSGEGAPNVVGLFKGGEQVDVASMNSYDCNLEDLPVMLLQQVASQVVCWLHEESQIVGMKATRDFLALSFELDQGDMLSLVAHVDPDDAQGCISWWLVMENSLMEESRYSSELSDGIESENRKFLGHLTLESLYSILLDLVRLFGGNGSH